MNYKLPVTRTRPMKYNIFSVLYSFHTFKVVLFYPLDDCDKLYAQNLDVHEFRRKSDHRMAEGLDL